MATTPLGLSIVLSLAVSAVACAPTAGASRPAAPDAPAVGELGPGFALAEGERVVPRADGSRAYWSVVRKGSGGHYLLPRPDGAPALAEACAAGGALAARLTERALCAPAESEAEVARVNELDEVLALEVSALLHRGIQFRSEGGAIVPSPLSRDLLAICKDEPALRDGVMKARCDDEEKYAGGGPRPAIFMMWSEGELAALPAALDALYAGK